MLGPNGAGKTSTVEALEGYRRPSGGSVRVLGLDPIAEHATLMPEIGVMLQAGGVSPGTRPAEAVRTYASFYADAEDPDDLLDRVGLTSVRRSTWRNLSGGEQQRAVVGARAGRQAAGGVPRRAHQQRRRPGPPAHSGIVRDLAATVRASCSPPTTWPRPRRWPIGSSSSTTVAWWWQARRESSCRPPAPRRSCSGAVGHRQPGCPPRSGSAGGRVSPGSTGSRPSRRPATVAKLTAWLADHDQPLADLRAGRQRLEDVFVRLTRESSGPSRSGRRRR